MVPPGRANCLACRRSNLRGGDNTCPVKELRDHPNPELSLMERSRVGMVECGTFRPLGLTQAQHRLGVATHRHRDRSAEGQESLF